MGINTKEYFLSILYKGWFSVSLLMKQVVFPDNVGSLNSLLKFKIFRGTVTKQRCSVTHCFIFAPLCFKHCYFSRLPKPIEDIAEVRRRRLFYHIFPGEPFLKSFFPKHSF